MSTFTVLKYCERYRQVTVSQSFLCEMFTTAVGLLPSVLVKLSGEAMSSAAGSPGRSQSIWSRFLKRSSEVPSRRSSAHSQVSYRSVVSTRSCLLIASMDLISSNFPLRTACLFSYGISYWMYYPKLHRVHLKMWKKCLKTGLMTKLRFNLSPQKIKRYCSALLGCVTGASPSSGVWINITIVKMCT